MAGEDFGLMPDARVGVDVDLEEFDEYRQRYLGGVLIPRGRGGGRAGVGGCG